MSNKRIEQKDSRPLLIRDPLGGWRSVAGGENGGYTAVNHDISVSALSTRRSASIAEILLRILGLYGVLYGNFP